ncbi:e3 ubiquitin-protein ligase trim7 [Anaeramoeba flamelloides]|uniref:E3 ubiquitin-protein ligase trim7 n=1 Tax=Anaeramoeba flamelloides TaxID=1746091 RepID=A0ABQ8YT40_9EUKA|nr:e3 ubiquitin-protein ligase trim7 [Anaeramoeba flamelloides]
MGDQNQIKKKFKPNQKPQQEKTHEKEKEQEQEQEPEPEKIKQEITSKDLEKQLFKIEPAAEQVEEKCASQIRSEEIIELYGQKGEIGYCTNCESKVRNSKILQIYNQGYDEKIESNDYKEPIKCKKHNKEFKFFCSNEQSLMCAECGKKCKNEKHELLAISKITKKFLQEVIQISKGIQIEKTKNKKTINDLAQINEQLQEETEKELKLIKVKMDEFFSRCKRTLESSKKLIDTKLNNYRNIISKRQQNNQIKENIIKKIFRLHSEKEWEKEQEKMQEQEQGQGKEKEKEKEMEMEMEQEKEKENEREKEREIILEFLKLKKIIGKERKILKKNENNKQSIKNITHDEFDSNIKQNWILLNNNNKTFTNISNNKNYGIMCGKKIYSEGIHQIMIKIDQFPNSKKEWNVIRLGIINSTNKENIIKNANYNQTYCFRAFWNKKKLTSSKVKMENGNWQYEDYPNNIKLKQNDLLTLTIDMIKKNISFKINEIQLETAWDFLPEKVVFIAFLYPLTGDIKNKITLI